MPILLENIPYISTHSPPPYTSSWETSISTANRTLIHTKHSKRECLIFQPLCFFQRETAGKIWGCVGLHPEAVCRPLRSIVTITNNEGKRWVWCLGILIHKASIWDRLYTRQWQAIVAAVFQAQGWDFSMFDKATRGGRNLNDSGAHCFVPSPCCICA